MSEEPQDKQAQDPKPANGNGLSRATIAAGVGMAIGSAALVAALLYANRGKAKEKKPARPLPPEGTD